METEPSFGFWSHVDLKGHLNQHQLEIERARQMWSFHSWNTACAFFVCVYISIHVCVPCIESSKHVVCVFFLSLLLLEPQPSLIICSEKVIYVAELLLSVITHRLQYTVVLVLFMKWFSGIHCMLHLNSFLLNAFVFSVFAIVQGGGEVGGAVCWPWNPSALVL